MRLTDEVEPLVGNAFMRSVAGVNPCPKESYDEAKTPKGFHFLYRKVMILEPLPTDPGQAERKSEKRITGKSKGRFTNRPHKPSYGKAHPLPITRQETLSRSAEADQKFMKGSKIKHESLM